MLEKIKIWLKKTINTIKGNYDNSTNDHYLDDYERAEKYLKINSTKKKKEEENKDKFNKSISLSKHVLKTRRKLSFCFIPKAQANRNARSFLEFKYGDYKKWQSIRDIAEEEAKCVCVICGRSSKDFDEERKTHTEAHEEWFFKIDRNGKQIQRLLDIYALCFVCHNIKHLDNHEKKEDYFNALLDRYAEINEIDINQANKDYQEALEERQRLDKMHFDLDLAYLGYEKEERYFNCHSSTFNNFLIKYLEKAKKSDQT